MYIAYTFDEKVTQKALSDFEPACTIHCSTAPSIINKKNDDVEKSLICQNNPKNEIITLDIES